MLIISATDNEKNRWMRNAKKKKKKKRKKESGDTGCSERVGAKWFCCTFKFGFL